MTHSKSIALLESLLCPKSSERREEGKERGVRAYKMHVEN